ncbi:SH3 domain-containing protein [Wolbachia endosymbiont of Ctenocephalides felis wCfeT]|nr:hypothetical protein [Wolbachia endosymbiont of Ctenocephalides felis wCfeT]
MTLDGIEFNKGDKIRIVLHADDQNQAKRIKSRAKDHGFIK